METDGIEGHQDEPSKKEQFHNRKKHSVPGGLVGFADPCDAFRQQSRVMPEQPSAKSNGETKEQNEKGPPRKPGDGARSEKQD